MQYMLLIYAEESGWESMSADDRTSTMERYRAFTEELQAAGAMVGAERLQPTGNATTLRIRDGERLVTDGPFAETKEQLGGYYLIEADSLDEALDWAARIPSARDGSIEVRPVVMREVEVA